jgi:hypothetical protein
MMKTLLVVPAFLLSMISLSAQNDTIKVIKLGTEGSDKIAFTDASGQINPRMMVGTWRHNAENGQLKLKLLTPTHFLWVDFNERNHMVTSSLGGTYSVNNDVYTEHIQFQSGVENDYTGTDANFETTVDQKKLHIKGTDNSYDEVWDRQGDASVNSAYMAEIDDMQEKMVGTWKLEGSGDHVKLKYITPTHYTWVEFPNDDSKVIAVRGGTYTLKDNVYTESLDYQMKDDDVIGKKYSFEVDTDGDVMHVHGVNNSYNETWRKVYDNSSYIGAIAKKHKDENKDDDSKKKISKYFSKKSDKFHGHWAGIDIGLNTYLNKNMGTSMPAGAEYMSLNPGKSINVNLNLLPIDIPITKKSLGIQTGLGIEFYNYRFENSNSIYKDASGVISEYPYTNLEKSKLSTTFLVVPLILETSFPVTIVKSHRMHIAGGVIGGLRIGSHTKTVCKSNGYKYKEKVWGAFNQNYLRYGFTARVGIDKVSLYSSYYPVSIFKSGKGPELYPFNVGLSFGWF